MRARRSGQFRRFAAAVLASGAVSSTPIAPASSYESYVTASEEAGIPMAEPADFFECSDRIFAVIEFNDLESGDHSLEIVWRDPAGNDRERNALTFPVSSSHERLWAWLKLHRPPGGTIASILDPASGLHEFIGEWRVEFWLDGNRVAGNRFQVLC